MRRVFYGWIVVAASATIVCVALGCLFALGVFLAPIERAMGWSRGAISTVALLNWIAMGLGSFFWGALSDRIGGRGVAVGGGFLLGLGLVLASQAQALWQFSLSFGFLVGFAAGAFYAPLTATTTRWFTARRGLAVALVSAGIGLGILIVAPLARALTSAWDWRVAMLVLGDLAWLVIVPVALLLREPATGAVASDDAEPAARRDYTTREVLAAPQFWAIALTHFACCAAHSGPIFHMVTHATDQGGAAPAATPAPCSSPCPSARPRSHARLPSQPPSSVDTVPRGVISLRRFSRRFSPPLTRSKEEPPHGSERDESTAVREGRRRRGRGRVRRDRGDPGRGAGAGLRPGNEAPHPALERLRPRRR